MTELIKPGMARFCDDCAFGCFNSNHQEPCEVAAEGRDPSITYDPEKKEFFCNSFEPNLGTRFNNLVRRVSPMLRAIQSSLPQ